MIESTNNRKDCNHRDGCSHRELEKQLKWMRVVRIGSRRTATPRERIAARVAAWNLKERVSL